jgi:hypothetical protein
MQLKKLSMQLLTSQGGCIMGSLCFLGFCFSKHSYESDWQLGASISITPGCLEGVLDPVKNACIKRKHLDNSCTTKNFVSPVSGEKFYRETNYQGAGAHLLDFHRL